MKKWFIALVLLLALSVEIRPGQAQTAPAAYNPEPQSAEQFYNEAQTVYLGNLERRATGAGPLRWNRELTLAARWFAWDSVEQRSSFYCGHTDTTGGSPWDRALDWGYLAYAGAENAFCGSNFTPSEAIDGWMHSDGHRANLLNATFQEIGVGYYRRASDGRMYAVQLFGLDNLFPPLIIENDKPATTSQAVTLYQYNIEGEGGISNMGRASQMILSSNACFSGASWQPYQTETQWSLSAGQGWKTVYSKIRDRLGRTSTASDTIYSGANLPAGELSLSQLTRTSPTVTLYGLNSGGRPYMQFSPGWVADDSHPNFTMYGDPMPHTPATADAGALGGTVFRMAPGGNTWAWVWTYKEFPFGTSYVAYFRLKTNSRPAGPVITITAEGKQRTINGTDFSAAGQYQEFELPFTYTDSDNFMIFEVSLAGSATVDVDAITLFSPSVPAASSYTWQVPGGRYRGQNVWVRYTNDLGQFTGYQEAQTSSPISVSAGQVTLLAEPNRPSRRVLAQVSLPCGGSWSQVSKPDWLTVNASGNTLSLTGSAPSSQTGSLVLQSGGQQVSISARLVVVEHVYAAQVPVVRR